MKNSCIHVIQCALTEQQKTIAIDMIRSGNAYEGAMGMMMLTGPCTKLVVEDPLPPEPPVGSIVAVTIRGDLYAMQRYEQGWYCNRHRLDSHYVFVNDSPVVMRAGGSGGSGNIYPTTPPCPNCPDTWEAMHAETSPVRVLYWKGEDDGS